MIVSCLFLVGCVVISLGSVIIAKTMVDDAHKKIYVLDGNVPILVKQTDMSETFDVEQRVTLKCSIIFSSPLHLMTSIFNIPCRRLCISLMKLAWLSTMP